MALEKRKLSNWNLVYDTERRDLYVETDTKEGGRISVDSALKLESKSANELRLAVVDLFK
jgi:hypothetical protein